MLFLVSLSFLEGTDTFQGADIFFDNILSDKLKLFYILSQKVFKVPPVWGREEEKIGKEGQRREEENRKERGEGKGGGTGIQEERGALKRVGIVEVRI